MGGQRQALRKKPRANFTGRCVWTGGENLAPTQSVAMPHRPSGRVEKISPQPSPQQCHTDRLDGWRKSRPNPVRSNATPTGLSRPKARQTRSSKKRSFGNILCHSNCKIIFITTAEVQIGYNNNEQRWRTGSFGGTGSFIMGFLGEPFT